jgi:C-terminal processing protease CtpA/Prc
VLFVHTSFDLNFNGKIWMLVNENMGSAAQVAAWFAKESGFATLVGDITGGSYGGPRTNARLPNTGIALTFDMLYPIDAHGRPLEAGTIPHHFNLPGLDALETVLTIIRS